MKIICVNYITMNEEKLMEVCVNKFLGGSLALKASMIRVEDFKLLMCQGIWVVNISRFYSVLVLRFLLLGCRVVEWFLKVCAILQPEGFGVLRFQLFLWR